MSTKRINEYTFDPNKPNELKHELIGILGLNPFVGCNSASRMQMMSSHIRQKLVIANPSPKKILTGVEVNCADYVFSVTLPEKSRVIKVITRYPESTYSDSSFKLSPEKVVIYENDKGEISFVSLEKYHRTHTTFGYPYKETEAFKSLRAGAVYPKDTVLLDTPTRSETGEYLYGRELNVAFICHPCVSEDGIGICKDVLDDFAYYTYEKRVVEWGSDSYPLNLYGDDNNYKPFPDIGEEVGTKYSSGLLMALRKEDPYLLAVDQSLKGTQTLNPIFDRQTYVSGANGRVIDIKVYHQPPVKGETICEDVVRQPLKYANALTKFYREILDVYLQLKQERKNKLVVSPQLEQLLRRAMAHLNHPTPTKEKGRNNISIRHKSIQTDIWRAEFVIAFRNQVGATCKLTDLHGGKGVITHELNPEEMPVAANGLRADLVLDPAATYNRTNMGRLYEHYLNSVKYDIELRIKSQLGLPLKPSFSEVTIALQQHQEELPQILEYLNRYHDIVSPTQGQWMRNLSPQEKLDYLADCLVTNIYDYRPSSTQKDLITMLDELETEYQPTFDKVSFEAFGKKVTTEGKVRIGSIYFMLLEKNGHDWSAVSTSKVQQNGVISFTPSLLKYASPTKQQATRILGESEIRVIASYMGGYYAVALHDLSNNSEVRTQVVSTILSTPQPTQIKTIVDREKFKLGYSKPLQMVMHLLQCSGMELAYKPYDNSQHAQSVKTVYVNN